MQLVLESLALGESRARPVVKLATGTLLRHMADFDAARAFRELDRSVAYVKMVRFEQVGSGVPTESPYAPGRVGYRKSERVLTIDVHYNEINMVHDRLSRERPGGRTVPVSRDYLDTFTERIEAAVTSLTAWCDHKDAWADRDHFMAHWNAARAALRAGTLSRPFEFTVTPRLRDALDACWSLAQAAPLEAERFEPLADAYFMLRDVGWQEAEYEADLSQGPTRDGQPCKVSNFAANIATSRAPDDTQGYTVV